MLDTARERALLTRRLLTVLCTGSLAVQIGCYSYLPVQSELPRTTERVSLTVNDRGRVLLADRVGSSLNRIEGRIVRADSTNVVLGVTRVISINGDATNWLGEEVSIPRDGILAYQARPFSKPRTIALIGAVVGGLLAIALSISLSVSGGSATETPSDGSSGQG